MTVLGQKDISKVEIPMVCAYERQAECISSGYLMCLYCCKSLCFLYTVEISMGIPNQKTTQNALAYSNCQPRLFSN